MAESVPEVIEVDKTQFTPTKSSSPCPSPNLQERLCSPKKCPTPEQISKRQDAAERRRLSFESERVRKAQELAKPKSHKEGTTN
ncbi:hypothetical protein QOT17_023435 [Balamuthia mandrillaris]